MAMDLTDIESGTICRYSHGPRQDAAPRVTSFYQMAIRRVFRRRPRGRRHYAGGDPFPACAATTALIR